MRLRLWFGHEPVKQCTRRISAVLVVLADARERRDCILAYLLIVVHAHHGNIGRDAYLRRPAKIKHILADEVVRREKTARFRQRHKPFKQPSPTLGHLEFLRVAAVEYMHAAAVHAHQSGKLLSALDTPRMVAHGRNKCIIAIVEFQQFARRRLCDAPVVARNACDGRTVRKGIDIQENGRDAPERAVRQGPFNCARIHNAAVRLPKVEQFPEPRPLATIGITPVKRIVLAPEILERMDIPAVFPRIPEHAVEVPSVVYRLRGAERKNRARKSGVVHATILVGSKGSELIDRKPVTVPAFKLNSVAQH